MRLISLEEAGKIHPSYCGNQLPIAYIEGNSFTG